MWLSKRPLFCGIALGFLACCGFGRLASRQPMFEHFLRFNFPIQPQNLFYPTASELVSYLRRQMIPGKKLALVGGASYFRGTGQNPAELWSLRLQEHLGTDYQVINLAIDGAGITSFAAVPFQILAPQHPEMIYVVNGSPFGGSPRDGGETYRYVFWDAYYKGLFPAAVADAPAVQALRAEELRTADGLELHLGKWIDQWTYACDLWNYIGYKWLFTAWSDDEAKAPLKPRREYVEPYNPGYPIWQNNNEHDPAIIAKAEANAVYFAENGYVRQPNGHWKPDPAAWPPRRENWGSSLPTELHSRTFVVLLRANPYYMSHLTAEDWEHLDRSYAVGQRLFEAEGYHAVQFDRSSFVREDFLDSGHLMPSGGNKVAAATAARIVEVARENAAAQAWLKGPTGPLRLRVTLPAEWPRGGLELLRIEQRGKIVERVTMGNVEPGRIRFGYERPPQSPIYSAPESGHAGEARQLEVSVSGLYLPGEARAETKSWFWIKDSAGSPWVVPIDGADQPLGELRVGPTFAAGAQRSAQKSVPPIGGPFVGAVVRLKSSSEVWDRSLPLATTGHTGAGDVLVATWSAAGALSFDYDHWNDGERHSPELIIAPGSEHEVEFRLPALAGGKQLTVWIDGKVFWQVDVPAYAPGAGEVYWGRNPIQATSAELSLDGGQFVRLVK